MLDQKPPAVPADEGRPRRRLLDEVREHLRVLHYSIRTEDAYVQWVKRFILFHGKRHPLEMGEAEVEAFLTHLAVEGQVAASTQNQALAALLFLYRVVLGRPLKEQIDASRAKRPERLPVVLGRDEVRSRLCRMTGTHRLGHEPGDPVRFHAPRHGGREWNGNDSPLVQGGTQGGSSVLRSRNPLLPPP